MSTTGTSSSITTKKYNFHDEYQVCLPAPLARVFTAIASGDKAQEHSAKLSPLCRTFSIILEDTISLPISSSDLQSNTCRHLTTSSGQEGVAVTLRRQHFELIEVVKVFGLINKTVHLKGTYTIDEVHHVALYESINIEAGIEVWKLFEFTAEGDGTATTLKETIQGKCPGWMRFLVQSETAKSHAAHMNRYALLF